MAPSSKGSLTRGLGLSLAILAAMASPSAAGFTIQDLGVITPGGNSAGLAINGLGQVAGSATSPSQRTVAVDTVGSGGFHTIGAPGVTSSANAINVSGDVAGTYVDSSGIRHGFSTSSGNVTTIQTLPGGTYTEANAINQSGQVAGTGDTGNGTSRAFFLSGGTPTVINPLGTGTFSQGNGINDSGTVVGSSETSPGGPVHAFLSTSGGAAVDLLTRNSSGNFSYNLYGIAIASNNDVAGYGDVNGAEHAFYAPGGGGAIQDLGTLAGGSSSKASGINDLAQVVGAVSYGASQPGQPSSQAFIWDAIYGMFNLNTLISPSDQANWVLTQATGINDSDQITGVGLIDGALHGFLLSPIPGQPLFSTPSTAVPEPPALALAGLGLAIVAAWHRLLRRERTEDPAAA